MRFTIDLDKLEVITSAADSRRVTTVEGKRGDAAPFDVVFVRSGVAEELAADTVLTFGAKENGKFDSAPAVFENSFTLSGTGTTAVYSASPSFNTTELNALFLIDSNSANDPVYVDLMAEFTWQVGTGVPTSTKNFLFRVANDVIRSDDLAATPAYSPIGQTAPVNEVDASLSLNGILLVAQDGLGADGNDITVAYDMTGSGSPVVTLSGTDITVTAGSDCTSLAAVTAINAHAGASALVTASVVGESGIIGSVTETALAGGVTGTDPIPYLRVDASFLYLANSAGVWKKISLSSL